VIPFHDTDLEVPIRYRALGVMRIESETGEDWTFEGLIPMADPPRHDTKETIEDAIEKGIRIKMITGGKGPFSQPPLYTQMTPG
jgi:hypothetical protein